MAQVNLRNNAIESSKSRPQRSMDAIEFDLAAATSSPWIRKEFMAVVTLSWELKHAGRTMKVWGRYRVDGGGFTEQVRVGDAAGAPIEIDISQGDAATAGSSIILDQAGTFDEILFEADASMTGIFQVGTGA